MKNYLFNEKVCVYCRFDKHIFLLIVTVLSIWQAVLACMLPMCAGLPVQTMFGIPSGVSAEQDLPLCMLCLAWIARSRRHVYCAWLGTPGSLSLGA